MDGCYSEGNPPFGSDFSPQASTPSKFNGAGTPRNDVVEVPQDIPIVLHDIPQLIGTFCAFDELGNRRPVGATQPKLGRVVRIQLAVRVICAVGQEEMNDKRLV